MAGNVFLAFPGVLIVLNVSWAGVSHDGRVFSFGGERKGICAERGSNQSSTGQVSDTPAPGAHIKALPGMWGV